ncbi:hypothetical protein EVG20_g2514 [Dentipellis fragilis]|uniref:NACHT domain-containing protein n=1 Tax=Dentipellis fragilis TaxID=205917 RepID=A0A4Y9Z7J1_9AGAM|nr:hypothetical protein EVG20_g2514 [Dentipellis fragilis]
MADNQLSKIWKAAIEQYEANTKINLKAASESHIFANISSPDELLKAIDDKQKNFVEYRKRGAKIKGALKPVLDVVGLLAGAAGEGVAIVFPPGKVVFIAVKLLVDASHNVKSHYDAIIDIFEQMKSFLLRYRNYVKYDSNFSDGLQQNIVKILAHVLFTVGIITKDMKRGQLKHFIQGAFTKNSVIQDALTKLHHLTKEEGLNVQAVIYQNVRDMSKGVNAIGKKLDKAHGNAELHRCHYWLSAPDPWINHNRAQEKLSEQSTGKWIFRDKRFVDWLNKSHSSIWLYGKSGGGKSMLCSTIINMLQEHIKSKTSSAVAFFYFDFKDSSKQNFSGLLRSLLWQLSSQSLGASGVLKKLYADHDNGLRQASQHDLQIALGDVLKHFGSIYIVLDALDECHRDDRDICLLPFVENMMLDNQDSVHFLATSRNEADIRECLETKSTYVVNLGDTLIHKDIEAYLSAVLQKQRPFVKYHNSIKEEIKYVLVKKANGMFLWVECQLKELKKCSTISALRKALHNLPPTLEETYSRILRKENYQDTEVLHLMLSWIAFAIEPLTKSELDAAVKLSYDEIHSESDDELLLLYSNSMLEAISSLIDISDDDGILLENGADANAQTYKDNTALIFASVEGHVSVVIILLEKGADINAHNCSGNTALIAASTYGHTSLVEILLEKGADVNAHDSDRKTALIRASYEGHAHVVKILLEKGASVNVHNKYDQPALISASARGHASIVRMLLEKGADVNAHQNGSDTALVLASDQGHKYVVHMLLEKGADVNAHESSGNTALIAASERGYTSIVRMLLGKGANVNACSSNGHTALMLASSRGHTPIVKILLEKGAHNAHGGTAHKDAL